MNPSHSSPGWGEQKTFSHPLIAAVRRGDLERCRHIIEEERVAVNVPDERGSRPLRLAIIKGNMQLCELLIKAGADVNGKGQGGITPMSLAAGAGRTDICELLLANGADVNAHNSVGCKKGQSPLFASIQARSAPAMVWLVEHGADIQTKDKSTDLTPLMTLLVGGNAICDDLTPMLECLIREITKESGAAISFEDREDVFASSPAAETIPALKAMLSTEDRNGYNPFMIALHRCACGPMLRACRLLASLLGAETVAKTKCRKSGETAIACALGSPFNLAFKVPLCEMLLQARPKLTTIDLDGRTPLMAGLISCRAMGSTAAELTRLLLETEETYPSKINVNAKDYDGLALMHIVASHQALLPCADTLLRHGADINPLDMDGNSPLLLALKPQEAGVGPSPFVIDWFLQAGADPNIVNKSGHSALSLLISSYSRIRNDELFMELCNRLIVAGANVNHKTKEAASMLILALESGAPVSLVEQLLQSRRADINARGKLGYTALIVAILACERSRGTHVVQLLLQHGADVNVVDESGRTPLMVAVSCPTSHAAAVAKLLLQRGASPNAIDKYGRTPLLEAAAKGLTSICETLIEAGADVSHVTESGCNALKVAHFPDVYAVIEKALRLHYRTSILWLSLHGGIDASRSRQTSVDSSTSEGTFGNDDAGHIITHPTRRSANLFRRLPEDIGRHIAVML